MIWYILITIFIIVLTVASYIFYLVKKDEDWMDVITDKKRRTFTLKLILVAFLASTVLCVKNLYKMADCTLDATSLNTTGTYSWYKKECLLEPNKNGLIPMSRIRGSSNDNHGSDDDSSH